ncbi:QCR2 [Candida jiufengensis]|uniref:QCR2 n=1 Tax=Candida jiufengensis TaxID=497108 RepID=UPI002224DF57|nr:QCR2 [Candida jiufengensis]KAI5956404.1 QCR2 [Candida jiufengensis]
MLSRSSIRAYSTIPNAIKITAKDSVNELTKLAVVIDNAGAKNGKLGTSHLLSKFAFLSNGNKSALRFTRESELLGGDFSAKPTRDGLVLETKFLKQDLPYYVEELGNVLSNTRYTRHEFEEVVLPAAKYEAQYAHSNSHFAGVDKLHEITFRKGLGNPLYYNESTPIEVDELAQFAQDHFTGENITIHSEGADEADLTKFVEESAFCYLPKGTKDATVPTTFYKNQEARIPATGASTALIGIPVKPADFGKYLTLAAAIGTHKLPTIVGPLSKIPGATSQLHKHKEAGLFVISVTGKASEVAEGIKQAKKVADSVSSTDLQNSVKYAELSVALQSSLSKPLDIKVQASSAPIKDFNYVAVGDLNVLPFASDL